MTLVDKGYFQYAKYGSIGISWVLTTGIYFYLGYKGGTYLDAKLGSAPAFLLVGLLGAMALSVRSLFSEITTLINESDQASQEQDDARDREKSNKDSKEKDEIRRKGPP